MYQPDATHNPYTTHYRTQYPATTFATVALATAAPSGPFTFPVFSAQQTQQKLVETGPVEPPEPSVTPKVASKSIQRLLSYELKNAGFDSALQPAVGRLEVEIVTFVQQLFQRAQEYANLANRARAIPSDVLHALEEFKVDAKALYKVKKESTKRKRAKSQPPPVSLVPPGSRSPSPELLASDDEDAGPAIPTTLRNLPSYFPDLPPKHTYLQTPASPPKKAALPSLEKKLKTAALVQESLQNLLTATEDTMNQEDGELLGHIVNWEINTHPRKRWKAGSK